MVVVVGDTTLEPVATGVTVPMPSEIETLTAFADIHVRVEEEGCPPTYMVGGFASRVTSSCPVSTRTVTLAVTVPPEPVAVIV